MGGVSDDRVRETRARWMAWANAGQLTGYALFGVAIVAFVVGAVVGFTPAVVIIVVAALGVGSAALAPAIVVGYAARAAEREDRDAGR
jgi:hypothetical protein